jgi:hypothetical protein
MTSEHDANTKKKYTVTAKVSPEDKRQFDRIAVSEGIASASILRKLIKNVLRDKAILNNIIEKFFQKGERSKKKIKRAEIKTHLNEEDKQNLFNVSQEWDLMPGALAKILVKFYIAETAANKR